MASMLGLLEARETAARERVEGLREAAARAAAALEAAEIDLVRGGTGGHVGVDRGAVAAALPAEVAVEVEVPHIPVVSGTFARTAVAHRVDVSDGIAVAEQYGWHQEPVTIGSG
ncbi:hypothetical protein AB0D57_31280 [Streptomyces sp. NPDC048275]|uniref:hypothetical protein n=1 Tax=Streptomyces sp. NPDC048275 TaxID=3155629 RepID=UPI0033D4B1F8